MVSSNPMDLLDGAMAPFDSARALPFAAYRDPALFDLEMEHLFRGDWVAVCPANALSEAGDYMALNIGGEPLAVVRGEDGELRALSNVCRHRGTLMLEPGVDCLDGGTIVCPYHAWSYNDSGVFRGAPYAKGMRIDPEHHSLPQFRVEVWMGVAFVCLSPDAQPLSERLSGIAPRLAEFDMPSYREPGPLGAPQVWDANWKLILENGMESYHLFQVHKDTLERITPTRGAYYIEGSASWTLTGGAIVQESGSGIVSQLLNRLFWSSSGGDHYTLVSIPPSFVGVVTDESWDWIVVHPISPTSTSVFQGSLTKQSVDRVSQRIAEGYASAFLEEDRAICERAQAGMASRHSQGGRLVPLERVVVDFHNYLGWRLTGQQPAPRYVEASR